MAGNVNYKGVIQLDVIVNATSMKSLQTQLAGLGTAAKGAASQLAAAGKIMRTQGLGSTQISQGLQNFTNSLAANNMALADNGRFINMTTGKLVTAAQVAKTATASFKKMGSETVAAKVGSADYNKTMGDMTTHLQNMGMPMFKIRQGIAGWQKDQAATNVAVKQGGGFMNTYTGKAMEFGQASSKVAKYGMKPFRGEFLSLMFIGMMFSKTFGGMIKQVMQMTGLFDMWRGVLASILLPILMPLITRWLPKFLDFLKSPEHRNFVGTMIIMAAALGFIVTIGAQFALLFAGFGVTFKGAIAWLAGGAKGFAALGNVLLKIGGIFVVLFGVFRMFSGFLQGNWFKMVSGVLITVAGIVALVLGGWIPLAIAGVITALVMLADKFKWVKVVVVGIIMGILSPFLTLIDVILSAKDLLSGKGFSFGSATKGLYNKMMEPEKMASGGIVTRPTLAMIGERGPEAVIPLSGGGVGAINYNPTINITSSGGGVDVNSLVATINERLYDDLRRIGIR